MNSIIPSNPTVLLSAGGFNWYGFLIGGAMVICMIIAYFMAKKRKYYADVVFDICLCTIPCAIVGARLYYVLFDIIENPDANWTFARIIGLDGGLAGLAIYGGLIGACLGALIVLLLRKNKPKYDKISFLQMADLAFPVIILGQAIGRWGNFANQEAYGNPVTNPSLQWFPYAVHIDGAHSITGVDGWFQATFFYESMWNLIGFALLMWLYCGKRKSFDGFVFSSYCIWYGVGRVFIEGLRTDSLWLIPDVIRISQLVSVILIIFGVAYICVHAYKARTSGKKPFIMVDEQSLCGDYLGYEKTIMYLAPMRPETEKKNDGIEFDEVSDEDRYWEVDQDEPKNKYIKKKQPPKESDEEADNE